MDLLLNILWLSICFQALAFVLALRLIPLSKKKLGWVSFSFAFLLMTAHRTINLLYQKDYAEDDPLQVYSMEIIALTSSAFLVCGVYLIRDILVERNKNEKKINSLVQAIEQSSVGIIVTNTHFQIEFINQYFNKKYIGAKKSWEDKNIHELDFLIDIPPDISGNVDSFSHLCRKAIRGPVDSVEIELIGIDKNVYWEAVSISPVIENEKKTHYVFIFEDFTEKKSHEKELETLALYDPLTNLPNRTLFIDRLAQQIINAKRKKESFAVFLLDLDRFKDINDTLGHTVGDILLKKLGPRLLATLRKSDTISRMGGDEFLILLPQVHSEQIRLISNKIMNTLSQPIVIDDYSLKVNASIGCAVFPQHGQDVKTLIKLADVAMYHAKRNHLDLSIYHKNFDSNSLSKLGLISDLHEAIHNNELYLKYQPKIDLVSNQYVGVEALVRWRHKLHGEILPNEFILLAEQTGLINSLTCWVLKTAITQGKAWHKMGICLSLSINLSAKDLHNPDLITVLEELLQDNFHAEFITLELTESSIMTDVILSLSILNQLSKMGIKLSIDDFGTGYSSLEYLARLPVNELKIDRSFVGKMIENKSETVIVRSTIELAHNLGLKVVAEGVEESATTNMLKALQCDTAQGFYFHKPQTAEEITRSLRTEANN